MQQPDRDEILKFISDLGFVAGGVAPAIATVYESEYLSWLAEGQHGQMNYLERHIDVRMDPRVLLPGAKSIICVADRHAQHSRLKQSDEPLESPQGRRGKVARYAQGKDYHKIIKRRLFRLVDWLKENFVEAEFKVCVDTAPLLEREHAQRAGLGSVGKNTLLLRPGEGSYLLLGAVVTTLEIEPTKFEPEDPCGSCTRCIDACPTEAIKPWSVDASRCISYLTIEHRSSIEESFYAPMGDWIFGCDVCQEVCPHNQPTRRSSHLASYADYEPVNRDFDLLEVLGWDALDRQKAFKSSSMKRARLDMMRRNAVILAGNEANAQPALVDRVTVIANDSKEDVLVREAARNTIERCGW
mgnify:CR=1 FL=1